MPSLLELHEAVSQQNQGPHSLTPYGICLACRLIFFGWGFALAHLVRSCYLCCFCLTPMLAPPALIVLVHLGMTHNLFYFLSQGSQAKVSSLTLTHAS